MRTLEEIMTDVIDDKRPEYDEVYYALKAYRMLYNMEHRRFRERMLNPLPQNEKYNRRLAEISYDAHKNAMSMDPRDYLGG